MCPVTLQMKVASETMAKTSRCNYYRQVTNFSIHLGKTETTTKPTKPKTNKTKTTKNPQTHAKNQTKPSKQAKTPNQTSLHKVEPNFALKAVGAAIEAGRFCNQLVRNLQ